jgi:hypothetical protein
MVVSQGNLCAEGKNFFSARAGMSGVFGGRPCLKTAARFFVRAGYEIPTTRFSSGAAA